MALFMASLVLRRDVLRWPMLVVALLAIVAVMARYVWIDLTFSSSMCQDLPSSGTPR